jgi:hypothetical protein
MQQRTTKMSSDVHFRAVTDDLGVTVMPHVDGGYAWFVTVGDQESSNDNLIYFRIPASTVDEAFATAFLAIMGKTNVWKIKARIALESLLHGKEGTVVWTNAYKCGYAVVYLDKGFYKGHAAEWSSDFRRSHKAESPVQDSLMDAIAWCHKFVDNAPPM